MRTLVINLLVQNPGHRVRISFEDVSIISSSFADELFGKLAVHVGIIDFGRLVAIEGMNALCKSLVESAIRQRVAQTEAANGHIAG